MAHWDNTGSRVEIKSMSRLKAILYDNTATHSGVMHFLGIMNQIQTTITIKKQQ